MATPVVPLTVITLPTRFMLPLPVNVFILEYPGYGARAGSPSEKSFLAAAEEAFAMLTNAGPIYVVGESLGTGVAAYLAKTHSRQVSGLVSVHALQQTGCRRPVEDAVSSCRAAVVGPF